MNFLGWAGLLTLAFSWLWLGEFYGTVSRSSIGAGFTLGAIALLVGRAGLTRRVNAWCGAAVVTVAVIAGQALLVPALFWLEACSHEIVNLQYPLHVTLGLFGIDSWFESGGLHLQTAAHVVPFPVTTEKLGLNAAVLVLTAALIVLCGTEARWRVLLAKAAGVAVLIACYVWLRLTVLTVILIEHPDPLNLRIAGAHEGSMRMFFDPITQWLSFLPLTAGLALCARRQPGAEIAVLPRRFAVRPLIGVAFSAVALCALVVGLRYQDPGSTKAGRILIDDAHSGTWARAGDELTRDEFGRRTVYNYATFRDYLSAHYAVELNAKERYTRESLAATDVLVLKTPIHAFEASEIDVIVEFVEGGGGLLLIGDHTNLLGMSTNSNEIARRFGMEFNLDACNRLDNGYFHAYSPSLLCSHPASRAAANLEFMTSCTLSVPFDAEPVLVTQNSFADRMDYKGDSFFGNVIADAEDTAGVHVIAAARKVGLGRVLLFGDSTIFSSFGVMQQGRAELALGMVDYLNRKNVGAYRVNAWSLWLSLGTLLAAAVLLITTRELRAQLGSTVPVAMLAGAMVGAVYCNSQHTADYPLSAPTEEITTIAFVQDIGRMAMPPALVETPLPNEKSFDTLFISTQRIGYFPRLTGLAEAATHDAIVLINPWRTPSADEIEDLVRYVEGGGRLLVMDSIYNPESTANRYLEPFDMHIGKSLYHQANDLGSQLDTNVKLAANAAIPTLAIAGGGPLFVTDEGHAFVNFQRRGEGIVVAVVDAAMFSRQSLGRPSDELAEDDPRQKTYRTAYAIFEECLFGAPAVTTREAAKDEPADEVDPAGTVGAERSAESAGEEPAAAREVIHESDQKPGAAPSEEGR